MHDQHRQRHNSAEQREGPQQPEELAIEGAVVHRHQVLGQVEGHAQQHIAHRHTEEQRRGRAADEERPIPAAAPARALALGTVLEAYRAQDQRSEDGEHREVEAREADRVERRPSGEDRAAAEDEPDLVALPDGSDGVDHHAALDVGLADERQQRADPHVKAVGEREADQQHPEQRPPDQAENFETDKIMQDHDVYSAGTSAKGPLPS